MVAFSLAFVVKSKWLWWYTFFLCVSVFNPFRNDLCVGPFTVGLRCFLRRARPLARSFREENRCLSALLWSFSIIPFAPCDEQTNTHRTPSVWIPWRGPTFAKHLSRFVSRWSDKKIHVASLGTRILSAPLSRYACEIGESMLRARILLLPKALGAILPFLSWERRLRCKNSNFHLACNLFHGFLLHFIISSHYISPQIESFHVFFSFTIDVLKAFFV